MKTTNLKFNNYLHDTEEKVLYLGISADSPPEEVNAFLALLNAELEIKHTERRLDEIKKVNKE